MMTIYVFAGRLGRTSGNGVADEPARRIGVGPWRIARWQKSIVILDPSTPPPTNAPAPRFARGRVICVAKSVLEFTR